MDRGAWRATVHGGRKESDTTEQQHFFRWVSGKAYAHPCTDMQVQSLGWEDPLEDEMATHSSILAWRIRMDRGASWATVRGVAESRTRLK